MSNRIDVKSREDIKIGYWQTYCCHLDLSEIKSESDIDSVINCVEGDFEEIEMWKTKEEALLDLVKDKSVGSKVYELISAMENTERVAMSEDGGIFIISFLLNGPWPFDCDIFTDKILPEIKSLIDGKYILLENGSTKKLLFTGQKEYKLKFNMLPEA